MASSSIARSSAFVISLRSKRARASLRRDGLSKLPTWSARNGGLNRVTVGPPGRIASYCFFDQGAPLGIFSNDAFDQCSCRRNVGFGRQMALEIFARQVTRDRWIGGECVDQRAPGVTR